MGDPAIEKREFVSRLNDFLASEEVSLMSTTEPDPSDSISFVLMPKDNRWLLEPKDLLLLLEIDTRIKAVHHKAIREKTN